jgi:glutaredoxin
MNNKILFSLENCIKCNQTKKLIKESDEIEIIVLPHDFSSWNQDQINSAQKYDVFNDLQRTAPILWVDGEKLIGYLRIRKWLADNK